MIKANNYIIVLLIFSIFSCSTKEELVKKPENLLPKEQLIPITAELHLLESAISMSGAPDTAASRYYYQKSQSIYQKFATDSVTYRLSYEFYEKNNNEMNIIYQAVNDTLKALRTKIESDTLKKQ